MKMIKFNRQSKNQIIICFDNSCITKWDSKTTVHNNELLLTFYRPNITNKILNKFTNINLLNYHTFFYISQLEILLSTIKLITLPTLTGLWVILATV